MKVIIAVLLLGACHKSSPANLTPPASLFQPGDLDERRAFSLSADDIKGRMQSATQFYVKEPSASPSPTAADTCISDKLAAVPVTADRINLSADATVDLSSCLATDGLTLREASYHLRYWLGCPKGDLTGLDGQPLGALGSRTCGEPNDYDIQIGFEYVYDASGTETVTAKDGSATTAPYDIKTRHLFAVQLPTGEPCPVSHQGQTFVWHDGCELVEALVYEQYDVGGEAASATGDEEYLKLSFTGITQPDAGTPTWFSAGSMDVIWDDWDGSVTYTDAGAAPGFQLSNGTATVSGQVGS